MQHTAKIKHLHTACTAVALAALSLLSACGGGASDSAAVAAPAEVSSTLSGTVAVGAPISNGTLRVLDANGAAVASDIVVDEQGRYVGITLTGPAPYRIEACGYAGPNYQCNFSVAQGPGTAHVTPLTSAAVLLATGQAPEALMAGTAPTLTAASITTAQEQLRSSLASVLSSAGVSPSFDFVSGSLAAGSRSGYDGVLDAIGVSLGKDANAFVQISPRLGSGNLYLEQGSSAGSVSAGPSAATLQLDGLEQLFKGMTAALASASACGSPNGGLATLMASSASLSMDGPAVTGAAAVAAGLCSFFGAGEDGQSPMWGATLLSPKLGRCELGGANPVCAVSFVLRSVAGDVQPVGSGMGVTREAGVWKFAGDLLPIAIQASAKVQRTVRVDGETPLTEYNRALAFEVAALPGLACASVSQKDSAGNSVLVAYYKPHPGAVGQQRLSLWTPDGFSWAASHDALVGQTRSADDTWLALPEGEAGDQLIRNFYRGGRSVTVALYGNSACSTPFTVAGRSSFEVDVDGVPPVWAAMPSLPWPEIDGSSAGNLRNLALAAGASGELQASWTLPRGNPGLDGATVCASRADCGQGGTGRLGERGLRPANRAAVVPLSNPGGAVGASDAKTLALYGRSGDGVGLQSNYSSCQRVVASEACH